VTLHPFVLEDLQTQGAVELKTSKPGAPRP